MKEPLSLVSLPLFLKIDTKLLNDSRSVDLDLDLISDKGRGISCVNRAWLSIDPGFGVVLRLEGCEFDILSYRLIKSFAVFFREAAVESWGSKAK